MASGLHSDAPLECLAHCCTALQLREILTRTSRERLRTHGAHAVARSMEFNKDFLGVMSVLLEQPEVQVNLPEFGGEEGNTILNLAILMDDQDEDEKNRKGCVSLILQRTDLDPNVGNNKGDTAVHSAARASSVSCLDILLDDTRVNIAAVNNIKQTCLHVTCEASSAKTCDRIVTKIIDSASLNVRSLTQFLGKQDQIGNTALHYAAERGLQNVVDLIFEAVGLDKRHELAVKKNHRGNLAIHGAAKNGHHAVVERMLALIDDSHCDVVVKMKDQDGFGLLHHAVVSGHQGLLQLCLPKAHISSLNMYIDMYMELLAVARQRKTADYLLRRLNYKIVEDSFDEKIWKRKNECPANLLLFGVSEDRGDLVALIVKWHPELAPLAMHEALETRKETIQGVVRNHPEVEREFVKLHRAYTYYVSAAGAILVVAILILTVTYVHCLSRIEAAQRRQAIHELAPYLPGSTSSPPSAPLSKKVQWTDFVVLPRWAFFLAMLATILAAFAALPFSFAFFFHEAVDDSQVKRLLQRTRVLIVSASYFLMLSIGALFFSFVCSQFLSPYIDYSCVPACEVALLVFVVCATLFVGYNFVRNWRTRSVENGWRGTREETEMEEMSIRCE